MGRCTACLLFLVVVISRLDVSWTRPRYLPRSKENDLLGFITRSRSSQCTDVSGPCYSSGHCCKSLVCIPRENQEGPLNDLLGQCIRESDLEGCESSADCRPDCRCVEFGRRRAKYCLPRGSIRRAGDAVEEEAAAAATQAPVLRAGRPPVDKQTRWRQSHFKVNGGFGSYCETNSDCSPLTEQGAPLCCQQVRRGRQLPKKMCDYLTPISVCIS